MNSRYLRNRYRFERILSVILLPLFLLVILLVIPFALIFNGSPIFFTQERYGHNQKRFKIIKFRTMTFKDGKPHINWFSKFLRTTRLDEFPQIINLLKGEVSFIGPRPQVDFVHDKSIVVVPEFYKRYRIKPGLMGYAQINQSHTLDIKDSFLKTDYDLFYINNVSAYLDLLIVFKTIFMLKLFNGK